MKREGRQKGQRKYDGQEERSDVRVIRVQHGNFLKV